MTDQQRRAAATITLLVVLFSTCALGAVAIAVIRGSGPLGEHFPGRQFILIIHDQSGLQTMLKALPIIVSVGLTIVARYKLKDWQYYATVAVTVIGIMASAYLYVELAAADQARRFWAYSPVEGVDNYASFTGLARSFLMIMGLWFMGILGAQLGMKNLGEAK